MLVSIKGLGDWESEMAPRNNGRGIRKRSVGLDDEDAIDVRNIALPHEGLSHIFQA